MKRFLIISLVFALLWSMTACAQTTSAEKSVPDQEIVTVAKTADPETAMTEIYRSITISGLHTATEKDLRDKFLIDPELLDDYDCTFSDGRFGLADVFILKPVKGKEPQVRESLEKIKLSRAREFENYDIRNAHRIAQDASIFEQGGYVIMLMLDDTEAARKVIDQYIPKNLDRYTPKD